MQYSATKKQISDADKSPIRYDQNSYEHWLIQTAKANYHYQKHIWDKVVGDNHKDMLHDALDKALDQSKKEWVKWDIQKTKHEKWRPTYLQPASRRFPQNYPKYITGLHLLQLIAHTTLIYSADELKQFMMMPMTKISMIALMKNDPGLRAFYLYRKILDESVIIDNTDEPKHDPDQMKIYHGELIHPTKISV
jgi:hypothetical protein